MTNKEIDKINKNVIATMGAAGLTVSEDIIEMGRKLLKGEITVDETMGYIKNKYKKEEINNVD